MTTDAVVEALPLGLERHVHVSTRWRVRNLFIDLSPDGVVLCGETTTTYTRHLAHQAVRDFLPHLPLLNALSVDHGGDLLPGVPLS